MSSKFSSSKSVLCNMCAYLKKHCGERKVLCQLKGSQVVRINNCSSYRAKENKRVSMLEWCD